jgi:hypothetical protein
MKMSNRQYWLDLFTATTWEEFKNAGGKVSGFRKNRWNRVQKINIGDYFLCYLTGISRFIGILEITGEAFQDNSLIWHDEDFPARIPVKIVLELTPETAVPVLELKENLTFFENMKSPMAWTGHFRGSPFRWKNEDGEAVVEALIKAKKHPVHRPVDEKRLKYRPKAIRAKIGSVTIPDKEENDTFSAVETKKSTDHTEIQWLLLKLGSDMGFNVWVARNDKSREFNGNRFNELENRIDMLPLQFDEATNKTIELIDVLWLQGNSILAAFEIESTTLIYSGLLRMSDLVAMQPNLNIPLYLVAPDDKRDKVISEINRPTFSKLSTPLAEICRFISFSSIRNQVNKYNSVIKYLKPEFLEEISESCEVEEA